MKRKLWTVVAGLALALTGAAPAAAGLPLLGGQRAGTQASTFGDQTVEEQKSTADVTQKQGNGNVKAQVARPDVRGVDPPVVSAGAGRASARPALRRLGRTR